MCDLIVYMFREMCLDVVVFAGVQSLRSNYNIRHANLHEILTFSDIKFYEFEQLPHCNLCVKIKHITTHSMSS